MHPRDDQAALESERDEIRRRLDEATRKADELRRATQGRDALEEELADVEERLAQRKRRRVPLLEDVRIASPCTASWEAMEGDDRVRFCGECQKNVYNLSAMARDEAELLLAEREGSICVRLYQRDDGTVITADCPVGVRRRRRRQVAVAFAGAGMMAATTVLAAARTVVQGDMGPVMQPQAADPVPPAAPVPTPGPEPVVAPPPTQTPQIRPTMGAVAPRPRMGKVKIDDETHRPFAPQGPTQPPRRKLP